MTHKTRHGMLWALVSSWWLWRVDRERKLRRKAFADDQRHERLSLTPDGTEVFEPKRFDAEMMA